MSERDRTGGGEQKKDEGAERERMMERDRQRGIGRKRDGTEKERWERERERAERKREARERAENE